MNVFPDTEIPEEVDEDLANQEEGITNKNEGGMEPTIDDQDGQAGKPEEPETDAEGNVIEPEKEPEEEVISFDGGLGLPEMDLGTTITIDPMPEGVTDVAAPGPGEKTPGE